MKLKQRFLLFAETFARQYCTQVKFIVHFFELFTAQKNYSVLFGKEKYLSLLSATCQAKLAGRNRVCSGTINA